MIFVMRQWGELFIPFEVRENGMVDGVMNECRVISLPVCCFGFALFDWLEFSHYLQQRLMKIRRRHPSPGRLYAYDS